MKKLLFSAAALAVLFTACKDDDTNPTPQPTKLFLNLVRGTDSISATYNASNRIAKYALIDSRVGGHSYYNEPVYENNRLVKLNSSEDGPDALLLNRSYNYNAAGRVEKINFHGDDGKVYGFDSLAYDNAGHLVAFYEKEGDYHEKYALVWDSKGNIIKQHGIRIVDGVESKDTVTTTYTYDDKVNYVAKQPEIYLMEPGGPAFGLSANNILTEKTVWNETNTEEYTNEYTYDEDNYPVTKKSSGKYINNGTVNTKEENTQIRYFRK
ncbi:hypothetical protein [Chitinophaga tropicalis]|uniref:YD repeat-containing protein n=1 Tax=Chitinophaga tropicalis TaxID=2683588 RepID=A0A7K1U502_9BACT|nr:hypothetical protein [Chitinophaga tropicalis]MVT09442.1 hypothetical protein [Chitinophaga tropicalis]